MFSSNGYDENFVFFFMFKSLSQTGNLDILNEVESINNEAEILVEKHNCDIIIVLSHCGIDTDKYIAKKLYPKVSFQIKENKLYWHSTCIRSI